MSDRHLFVLKGRKEENMLDYFMKPRFIVLLAFCSITLWSAAKQPPLSINAFQDGIHHWNLEHKERHYKRYDESDFRRIADNLIAYQNPDGGWPKNIDWLAILPADSVFRTLKDSYKRSTLDNRNTFPQIEYLADVYGITKDPEYRKASMRGLDYLLATQHSNGGWRGWDVDAITFNDEVTTGALELFRNIVQGDDSFDWLDKKTRHAIRNAFERGIAMVLRCQVVQNGVKTAWGQQHDHRTFEPVGARSFELPSLTANESCPVIELLMGIRNPSPEVIDAVKCAVAWLQKVQLTGLRIERISLKEEEIINHEYPYDNVVIKDPLAKPIWARFYEVTDNTPFLCTRQGQKVWKLADVNAERRTGYDWYGYWPERILSIYPAWLERLGVSAL